MSDSCFKIQVTTRITAPDGLMCAGRYQTNEDNFEARVSSVIFGREKDIPEAVLAEVARQLCANVERRINYRIKSMCLNKPPTLLDQLNG